MPRPKKQHLKQRPDGRYLCRYKDKFFYVNTQLTRSGFKPYFWRNDKGTKEVDFIISIDGKLIPVEVKSGEHVTSANLNE